MHKRRVVRRACGNSILIQVVPLIGEPPSASFSPFANHYDHPPTHSRRGLRLDVLMPRPAPPCPRHGKGVITVLASGPPRTRHPSVPEIRPGGTQNTSHLWIAISPKPSLRFAPMI